ncbi:MAG: signal recognition particle protein [Coriobacteriia bacterium]|nr:signal recognition particle protein [Coriobacteriia bacterium]MCL2536921.1 signal recognition particle protein [Coriobacteriia bacterium]
MFDSLASRLQDVFTNLNRKGRLSEDDVDSAMREIRLALLEADVNFRVVKTFIARVRERSVGADVMASLSPGQMVVKIVLEELTALLGQNPTRMVLSNRTPNVLMMVGLQGSGKTTATAKLAWRLRKQGKRPLMVACDVHRPAAIDQLEALGRELQIPVYRGQGDEAGDAVATAEAGVRHAIDQMYNVVIVDTAGRLHVDEEMMQEATAIKQAVKPDQILMVVDAMTGQDAVNVTSEFAKVLDFDGLIMSKLDGDARGGAALSIREVTGKPILFASEGEKPSSLDEFHPDRMAKRILGMGDVVSLIETAMDTNLEAEIADWDEERLKKGQFTFDDFLKSIKQMRKMGGISAIMKMLPGGAKGIPDGALDDSQITRMEAIIFSMTPKERNNPKLLNGSRRARIAQGSGTTVVEVNRLMKQFAEAQKMMKQMGAMSGKSKKGRRGRGGMPGLPGL